MSILDKNLNEELTLEAKQEKLRNRVSRQSQQTFQGLRNTYTEIFNSMWNNRQGLTPQEAFDALGTEAGELFKFAGIMLATLEAAKPGSTDDLPKGDTSKYTINQDGTVSVVEQR